MNRRELYLLIIPFLLFPTLLYSQNNYDLKQFGNETGNYFSAPLHWNKNDFLTFGLIATGTFTLTQFDNSIKDKISKINSNKNNWLMD